LQKNRLNIPVCAIGGLNSTNLEGVREYAPDMIAVISDIWRSDDIKEKASFYN
jgi:thiamine-phosphate pyrophosphorylase